MQHKQNLRLIRKTNNQTQEQIAKILNTTQSAYRLYEIGERELPMHHYITLAKHYGVSIEYLAGVTDDPGPTAQTTPSSSEPWIIFSDPANGLKLHQLNSTQADMIRLILKQ